MSRRVIINADDLGLHVAVRRAVESLAERGTLTSASVLANGPDLEESVRLRGISLGAHLNILRGPPISAVTEIPSLVGSDGLFLGSYAALFARYATGRLALDEVELEWTRQMERLVERGARLTHVDGEKHTHAWPRLFPIARRVAAAFGVANVRIPRERWTRAAPLAGQARVLLLRAWLRRVERHDLGVWGIAHQGEHLTPEALRAALAHETDGSITSRTIEIACHPGLAGDGDAEIDARFGRMRVRALWGPELQSLRSERWRAVLDEMGWALASFDDVH
ncbi:MAG: ChbG/HpnK family deacetylase [Phycisphaerae bacterium]|nr:ChbG/HpnK family deacetylase [Phycisphaerae bacterium]